VFVCLFCFSCIGPTSSWYRRPAITSRSEYLEHVVDLQFFHQLIHHNLPISWVIAHNTSRHSIVLGRSPRPLPVSVHLGLVPVMDHLPMTRACHDGDEFCDNLQTRARVVGGCLWRRVYCTQNLSTTIRNSHAWRNVSLLFTRQRTNITGTYYRQLLVPLRINLASRIPRKYLASRKL
jgi:hypothetical protein